MDRIPKLCNLYGLYRSQIRRIERSRKSHLHFLVHTWDAFEFQVQKKASLEVRDKLGVYKEFGGIIDVGNLVLFSPDWYW